MYLLRLLSDFFANLISRRVPPAGVIFPYSTDPAVRRQEVWNNLESGVLFEDNGKFIPWSTSFSDLGSFPAQRRDSGDRTEWHLGHHQLFNGYWCHPQVMKWSFIPSFNPVGEITFDLGADDEGEANFHALKQHLTLLLGTPALIDLTKWGSLDLGEIRWTGNNIRISLMGIEHFNARYSARVGLIRNRNNRYIFGWSRKVNKN